VTAGAARRGRLRALLVEHRADALLAVGGVDVRYLTGFTGSAGAVLVGVDPDLDRLATDGRYTEQAAAEAPDLARVITRQIDWVGEALPADARLAVDPDTPWRLVRGLQEQLGQDRVVAGDGLVGRLRAIKDDAEIKAIAEACELSGEAFLATLGRIVPGATERDVARHLERKMVDFGADDRAFASIVASGPNGAMPHHRASDRVLQRGDLVTLDFGALVDGYHADMTRLVAIGEPAGELAAVVEVVQRAQALGVAAVRAGAIAGDVDAVCRTAITEAGHGEHFVHGTGHGVGLGLHEAPFVSAGASATLRDRMVVTVEPGIYLPGLGGARLEDTVVVGPEGADVLTATPKDLYVL
jgi:Xaa-Pro aminopeptidase